MPTSVQEMGKAIEDKLNPASSSSEIHKTWTETLGKLGTAKFFGMKLEEKPDMQAEIKSKTGLSYQNFGDIERDLKAQQDFTKKYFNNDAKASLDFLAKNSGHPEIANKGFAQWAQSAQAGDFVKKMQSPAVAQSTGPASLADFVSDFKKDAVASISNAPAQQVAAAPDVTQKISAPTMSA